MSEHFRKAEPQRGTLGMTQNYEDPIVDSLIENTWKLLWYSNYIVYYITPIQIKQIISLNNHKVLTPDPWGIIPGDNPLSPMGPAEATWAFAFWSSPKMWRRSMACFFISVVQLGCHFPSGTAPQGDVGVIESLLTSAPLSGPSGLEWVCFFFIICIFPPKKANLIPSRNTSNRSWNVLDLILGAHIGDVQCKGLWPMMTHASFASREPLRL